MLFPGSLFYALPLLAIAILTWRRYAFNRPQQTGAATFGWLMASMTVWSIFYTLELLAPSP